MRQWNISKMLASGFLFLTLTMGVHAEDISPNGMATTADGDSLNICLQDSTVKKTEKPKKPKKRYDDRIESYRNLFLRLIPTHSKLQFYGDMGLANLGIGWDYGKHSQWETDVLFGFIPKNYSGSVKVTMTLKQTFNPWSINLDKKGYFTFEPLQTGLYANFVFGNEFWVNKPSRYPKGYYGFMSKMRFHVFLGESFTYDIPDHKRSFIKSISAFGEISTCDLYLSSAIPNKYLGLEDWLRLSFGLKFSFL